MRYRNEEIDVHRIRVRGNHFTAAVLLVWVAIAATIFGGLCGCVLMRDAQYERWLKQRVEQKGKQWQVETDP